VPALAQAAGAPYPRGGPSVLPGQLAREGRQLLWRNLEDPRGTLPLCLFRVRVWPLAAILRPRKPERFRASAVYFCVN
jgi:hypothetical protein